MTWWHYTTFPKLLSILDTGRLVGQTVPVRLPRPRRLVWFSDHPNWEPTASFIKIDLRGRPRRVTFPEVVATTGAARLSCGNPARLQHIGDLLERGMIPPELADRHSRAHWRAALGDVRSADVTFIEVAFSCTASRWVPLDGLITHTLTRPAPTRAAPSTPARSKNKKRRTVGGPGGE